MVLFACSGSSAFCGINSKRDFGESQSSVYVELFGNGGLYSLNYDHIFYYQNKNAFGWRVGLSYLPPIEIILDKHSYSVLGTFNYLREIKAPHFIEFGVGITYYDIVGYGRNKVITWNQLTNFGYRYQKRGKSFFFRVDFISTYYLEKGIDRNWDIWGGLSLGYSLKTKKRKLKGDPVECRY